MSFVLDWAPVASVWGGGEQLLSRRPFHGRAFAPATGSQPVMGFEPERHGRYQLAEPRCAEPGRMTSRRLLVRFSKQLLLYQDVCQPMLKAGVRAA